MATILTLADVQRQKSEKGDSYGAAVVELFQQQCDPATLLDFKTLGTTEVKHRVKNAIATVGFRQGRGAAFGQINGTSNSQVTDATFQLGAEIRMDKTDVRDKEASGMLGERTQDAVKGMAWTFLDYFINGDHATEPHGFEGIKVRLANSAAGQIVYGNASNAELDVRASASPSDATLYTFLDKIDEAIDALDGSTGDAAFTSSDFIATLRSVLRRLGKYTERPVEPLGKFGSVRRRTSAVRPTGPVLVYPENKGIPWYDMGLKADQSTRVIGTDTVNSVACRPVYFVKLGYPYVHGIQQYAMEIDGPDWNDDHVTQSIVIDWPVGLHHVHNKSISKLAGVRVA
jgi:hypothetical protein